MTIDELQSMWRVDCVIDDDLGVAAVSCPMLHSKYLDELITSKLKLTKIQHETAILETALGRYYRGEFNKDELETFGYPQWQFKTLKGDIDNCIMSNADYQKLLAREAYIKSAIYFLESVLGEIKNRNWNIRAKLDWLKFRSGV